MIVMAYDHAHRTIASAPSPNPPSRPSHVARRMSHGACRPSQVAGRMHRMQVYWPIHNRGYLNDHHQLLHTVVTTELTGTAAGSFRLRSDPRPSKHTQTTVPTGYLS